MDKREFVTAFVLARASIIADANDISIVEMVGDGVLLWEKIIELTVDSDD